ncbi:putative AB5 enterotoxin binding subunit YtxB [Yersinia ruckeri]|uniref:putative AB5 enterotoxin binding subunit YtxB n=1 Tax=Yersinia ruckeri TaxID=29486 RepID=UPI000BDF4034|nr:putative AB5 enterotoxin binding subunit YtxB [Yersinia ruckeri]MCK8538386.1 putative AB5 enterotoxin binding subunit YtxB [Yersinia ruckeri]MCK8570132.1 putative AB5 enterotoxin binding subunit YtxB [Yersinia ruckeri]MCK8573785.1 putative AB5 enterotoxin binding subunit YtxB [Yersinia ruckeri]MCK8576566.1 putative AB5 enterotoxin binding subunit YtxB [Yersinia ruckeri]MCK8579976.1 putative AB5 enterotoxin binding subunit YtxB [Yersinia ruckeri]
MKIISLILTLLMRQSVAANSGDLLSQCNIDGGKMLYDRKIKNFNASIMWRPNSNPKNSININVDDSWYGTLAEDGSNGNSSLGLSSFAQAAYLINMPVNVCVKGKYLRGIEGV